MCKGYDNSMLQFADIIIDTFGSLASHEADRSESSASSTTKKDFDFDPIPMGLLKAESLGLDHSMQFSTTLSLHSLLLENSSLTGSPYGTCLTGSRMSKLRSSTPRKATSASKRYSKLKDPNGITLQCREIDILLGRGGHASNHAGNVKLLHAVKMNRPLYKSLGRTEIGIAKKRAIVEQIVSQVHSEGSRFLFREKKGGEWREASNRAVYEKISHMLRD